ncbi:hypothetical protein QFZ75_008008 [Streptomyces sp. V3I8]|uniref:hypothetical protein n=1 Tax=Streptomyces sp. V3I8 TaxID=3042279 RepID=UPI0027897163|nr:hypothetical protein [Streptomyces sp. V3I8]MDQ1041506.1 hypothetical protein [Streptomyces sp. V3I8]
MNNGTGSIHLQGVGRVPAVPASALTVGDQLMYNGGSVAQITKIVDASAHFLKITQVSPKDGTEHLRKIKKTSLTARVPAEHRRPLGHDAPATAYRAQVRAPEHGQWVTVSHGATAEKAASDQSNYHPAYFASVLLDNHGLGWSRENPDGRAASVKAMTDGETLTAADGHSFRILPPEQPQTPARRVVEGVVITHDDTSSGTEPKHSADPDARAAVELFTAAGHTPAELTGDYDPETSTANGFLVVPRGAGSVYVYHLVDGKMQPEDSNAGYWPQSREYRRLFRDAPGWEVRNRAGASAQAQRIEEPSAPTRLAPGALVSHTAQEWAHSKATAVVVGVTREHHDGTCEYAVMAGQEFARRIGEDNPMTRETEWNSARTRPIEGPRAAVEGADIESKIVRSVLDSSRREEIIETARNPKLTRLASAVARVADHLSPEERNAADWHRVRLALLARGRFDVVVTSNKPEYTARRGVACIITHVAYADAVESRRKESQEEGYYAQVYYGETRLRVTEENLRISLALGVRESARPRFEVRRVSPYYFGVWDARTDLWASVSERREQCEEGATGLNSGRLELDDLGRIKGPDSL